MLKTGYSFISIVFIIIICAITICGVLFTGKALALSENNQTKQDTVENLSLMFFVHHGKVNVLDIYNHPYFKGKENDFKFITTDSLPPGCVFSEKGILTWSPSADQFKDLQRKAKRITFNGQEQRTKTVVTGEIRMVAEGELNEAILPNSTLENPPKDEHVNNVVTKANPSDSAGLNNYKPLKLIFPNADHWNEKKEGSDFSFQLSGTGGSGEYGFEVVEPSNLMEKLDRYGNFHWKPDFNVVSTAEGSKQFRVNVRLSDNAGHDTTAIMLLTVVNNNRPPVVNELPTFYIQYDKENKYTLNKNGFVYDPDGDSIIFSTALKELPQGMKITAGGEVIWKPSVRQFNYLRDNPIYLNFTVEDYPSEAKSIGQLKIEVSQEDLPPLVTMIPNSNEFDIKENEELHLNFFITDPNGEDDILAFNFVSENSSIPENALTKKEDAQYEFSWKPGYDFIKEEGAAEKFSINFFAIDEESNRTEKHITVKVTDTENLLEKDRILYDQYRTALERAWNLIQQLNNKEKELNKKYKTAKKGKKNRAIVTASLGAVTGLSPVMFMDNSQGQKVTAGLGGTATATISTLEASNVIGESPSDIMKDLSYVTQKRSDLIVYGNVFATKFALPLSRRDNSFHTELRSLAINMNLKEISNIELDASWENPRKASDKNIKKIFKDFNPDPRFASAYEQ